MADLAATRFLLVTALNGPNMDAVLTEIEAAVNAIAASQLGSDSVTTVKILNAAVTNAKLANPEQLIHVPIASPPSIAAADQSLRFYFRVPVTGLFKRMTVIYDADGGDDLTNVELVGSTGPRNASPINNLITARTAYTTTTFDQNGSDVATAGDLMYVELDGAGSGGAVLRTAISVDILQPHTT